MISIWNSNARKVKCHCVDDEQKTFNNNNVGRFFFCFIQRKNHYKPLTIMIGNLVKNKPGMKIWPSFIPSFTPIQHTKNSNIQFLMD